jgi:hypothetical protein
MEETMNTPISSLEVAMPEPPSGAAIQCGPLLTALEQLHNEFEDARRKWKKSADQKNECYWAGRRDGVRDAIGQVKQLASQKAANRQGERRA